MTPEGRDNAPLPLHGDRNYPPPPDIVSLNMLFQSDGSPFPRLCLSMQMLATDFPGVVRLGSHRVMME